MRNPARHIVLALIICVLPFGAQAEVSVVINYLRQEVDLPPVLSNLDPVPQDRGIAGAATGLAENQTTGQFLGHSYELNVISVPVGGDVATAAGAALGVSPYLILDTSAVTMLTIADLPQAQGALLFNVVAGDEALRGDQCRANLLHVFPSDRMRTDALMQFFVARQWTELALITGTDPADITYAEALKASASKFGLQVAGEKTWAFDADMRRNAAAEVPLFTQDLPDHDVLLIADEIDDFGRYIPYNTWLPRPVAGTEGLVASGWSAVVENWGAAQLQSRFEQEHQRNMTPRDYAAWAAVRTLGEAASRTGSADPALLRDYILSDTFELAGFKGRAMTYRGWNGQLRQPIVLAGPRAMVAMAPLEGFLHQRNELDTLGLDAPESSCTVFGDNQ